jgi:hypothetical protein
VVEDSHHFDEEQEHDPDQDRIHINVKDWVRIRIRTEKKGWIRIHIKVMQIRNPGIILRMHRVSLNGYSGITKSTFQCFVVIVKYDRSPIFAKIFIYFFVKCRRQ